jgi:hypothetical protein
MHNSIDINSAMKKAMVYLRSLESRWLMKTGVRASLSTFGAVGE